MLVDRLRRLNAALQEFQVGETRLRRVPALETKTALNESAIGLRFSGRA